MEQTKRRINLKKLYLAGLITGIVNGLFGAGGGIIAVVCLMRLADMEERKAHATALVVMLPLTVISVTLYLLRGAINWAPVPWVALGLLPGSFLGAKLLGRLQKKWLHRIFCLLMFAAGVRLLF